MSGRGFTPVVKHWGKNIPEYFFVFNLLSNVNQYPIYPNVTARQLTKRTFPISFML